MAYTVVVQDAFNKGAGESGWDYQTAFDLIKSISDLGIGRTYVDNAGNFVYETRHARTA